MRTALSIKMLQILYGSHKVINREELAKQLDTNVRNISEFKRELEVAGYNIISTSGKYGGYRLDDYSLFPSLTLDSKEIEAINESLNYLSIQSEFIEYEAFMTAMNKVKAKVRDRNVNTQTIYLKNSSYHISSETKKMLSLIQNAKDNQHTMSFDYSSLGNDEITKRLVHPYVVIMNQEGAYLLAYEITKGKDKMFKFFKIIESRMSNVKLTEIKFTKDSNFKVNDYSGKHGLLKGLHEAEIVVSGLNATWLNEKEIENVISKRFDNDKLYLHFVMEGEYRLKSFLLSLGSSCKVISPEKLKQEIELEVSQMIQNYK